MAGWSLRGPLAAFLFLYCLSQVVSAADGTLAQSLQVLAQQGMDGTPAGLKAAEAVYQRAKRLAPQDGRVDYAWSLVLTKHRQFPEAAEALEKGAAAEQFSLQARTAQVRSTLKSGKFTQAVEELIELAERTGDLELTHLSPEDRRATAEWIGRAAAFLGGPLADPELGGLIQRREAAIRTYLGSWQADYDRGKRELGVAHRTLQDRLSLLIADADDRKGNALRENEEKRSKLDDAYKSASTEGAKAHENVSERLADINTKIGSLEKQFTNVLATESQITESLYQLQMESMRLTGDLDRLNNYEGYPAAKAIYAMKIQETQIEIELLQTDLGMVLNEKQQLLSQAGAAVRTRLATLSQQQQLEFQKTHDTATYQRLQRGLQENSKKVASSSSTKASRAQGLKVKMQSWSTYDPSTPASELARLAGL